MTSADNRVQILHLAPVFLLLLHVSVSLSSVALLRSTNAHLLSLLLIFALGVLSREKRRKLGGSLHARNAVLAGYS